jgi:hypothetical protein
VSSLYSLVRRMREEAVSRNRSYDELSAPLARRARRIDKWLRGLERDLRAGARVVVHRAGDGFRVSLAFPSVRLVRESYLTAEEHALLCADPALEPVLAPTL